MKALILKILGKTGKGSNSTPVDKSPLSTKSTPSHPAKPERSTLTKNKSHASTISTPSYVTESERIAILRKKLFLMCCCG